MTTTVTIPAVFGAVQQQTPFTQPTSTAHKSTAILQNFSSPPQPSVDPQWVASYPALAPGYIRPPTNSFSSTMPPACVQNSAKFPQFSTPPRSSAVAYESGVGLPGVGVPWNGAAVRPPALRRIGEAQNVTPNSRHQTRPAQVFGENIGKVSDSVYIHPLSPGGSVGVELGMPMLSPTVPHRGYAESVVGSVLAGVGRPVLGSVDQNAQYGYTIQNSPLDTNTNSQMGDKWTTWLNGQAVHATSAAQTGMKSAWRFAGNVYAKVRGQIPHQNEIKAMPNGGGDGMDGDALVYSSMPSLGSFGVQRTPHVCGSFDGIRVDAPPQSTPTHDEETGEADFAYDGYGRR